MIIWLCVQTELFKGGNSCYPPSGGNGGQLSRAARWDLAETAADDSCCLSQITGNSVIFSIFSWIFNDWSCGAKGSVTPRPRPSSCFPVPQFSGRSEGNFLLSCLGSLVAHQINCLRSRWWHLVGPQLQAPHDAADGVCFTYSQLSARGKKSLQMLLLSFDPDWTGYDGNLNVPWKQNHWLRVASASACSPCPVEPSLTFPKQQGLELKGLSDGRYDHKSFISVFKPLVCGCSPQP